MKETCLMNTSRYYQCKYPIEMENAYFRAYYMGPAGVYIDIEMVE